MLQYAARRKLGLAVSFVPVDQMARVAEKYYAWCNEAGWQPGPDRLPGQYLPGGNGPAGCNVVRGCRSVPGQCPGSIALRPSVSRAVQAARAGEEFDLRHILAGSVQGDVAGAARGLNFMGGPDTVAKQIKAFHDQCGVGVVDLFSSSPA